MVNTILARRGNHIVAKGDNPIWPKGSKSRGFSKGHLEEYGILRRVDSYAASQALQVFSESDKSEDGMLPLIDKIYFP